jgi:hypothetical protein
MCGGILFHLDHFIAINRWHTFKWYDCGFVNFRDSINSSTVHRTVTDLRIICNQICVFVTALLQLGILIFFSLKRNWSVRKEGFCSVCNGLICMFHYMLTFLVTFAKLQKVTISSAMPLSSSVRPSGATLLSLDGFSWNLSFEDYSNIEKIQVSLSLARIIDTLHVDLRTLVIIYC